MQKYQQVIHALYQEHAQELAEFKQIHDKYALNQDKWQKEFNSKGAVIVELMHGYEKQLCGKSERSGMGMYSSKLAEKFWTEIKTKLPMIDFVGVTIS
jgi:hypothetical protein